MPPPEPKTLLEGVAFDASGLVPVVARPSAEAEMSR